VGAGEASMATAADTRLVIAGSRSVQWAASTRALAGWLYGRPILRALLKAVLTVFAVVTLTFFLIRLMPGSPIEVYINTLMSEQGMSYTEAADVVRGKFSVDLNRPVIEQYATFLGNLARGNLGNSLLTEGVPVTALILQYLPWTLFAVGTGLLVSFSVGIALGVLTAYWRNSLLDHVLSSVAAIFASIPDYLIGIMIVVFLGVQLRWVPITQMRGVLSPGVTPGPTLDFLGDMFFHAALPIATYVLAHVGVWMLTMKNSTLTTLGEDYVTVARARGLTDGRITTAYVGRNAVLPLFTQFTISAGFILGGAVFIETIFVYQGLGWQLLKSISARDYPVMQGIVLLITGAVVLGNLAADLLYSRLDPRIGLSGRGA
jgi:peptide/nickel transport system permease protein